ncbi:hypothetical protein CLG96_05860 [Sphingomonas oleivorans]|uniref:Uncharacterized protein n=1 Tax=Sphingomonas oleivorans TaxID=1735121 RepID=A0A2T5FZG3_9SPHN|nr:hypothetical protein [Sphingomonas oleivorans]PTQ12092.1 hypothetical protein CLG96_05860 [Sphingomonas oleivorans]
MTPDGDAAAISRTARRAGAPDWIDGTLLRMLDGGLWHATKEHAWRSIVNEGKIRADAPPLYKNGFCRSIGGVSLFDLTRPDDAASPAAAHWSAWLGATDDEPRYWIEIERSGVAAELLTTEETLSRWREAFERHSPNLRIIAGLETAHIGSIPLDRTCRVLRLIRGQLQEDPEAIVGQATLPQSSRSMMR